MGAYAALEASVYVRLKLHEKRARARVNAVLRFLEKRGDAN